MPRLLLFLLFLSLVSPAQDKPQDGGAVFQTQCAVCHNAKAENRTPTADALKKMTKPAILEALETGAMKIQGAMLTRAQRVSIADFLTAGHLPETSNPGTGTKCVANVPLSNLDGWNGWGADLGNSRFQPESAGKLTVEQISRLKVKWAWGFSGSNTIYGQPTIAGGRVFLGSDNGTVSSLDAATGCVYWTFKAPATVRTAISIGPWEGGRYAAYFGDVRATAYAVDASSGELLWKTQVDTHKVARITGAPKLSNGRLYVPVSSIEEVSAGSPSYVCCTFRGSIVALDAQTGKQIWKTYSIPDPPGAAGTTSAGTARIGPAGGAIWSSPTLDLKRKLLYVGSGNQYSGPPSPYTDALLAIDMETGSMRWAKQLTPNDGWNFACINPNKASCPEHAGEDVDIGTSPILRTANGKDVLVVGQKSGVVHALDPDQRGNILWQTRIGHGGPLGGIMWGMAAEGSTVYVPLADFASATPDLGGGLFAINAFTGEKKWYTAPVVPACKGKVGCSPAQMAAATAIAGAVFSPSMDGHIRAYRASDGTVFWDFDTLQEFPTVNGIKAHGGSISGTGAVIANGMLFVNSGYASLGGMAGNLMLAFSVDGK